MNILMFRDRLVSPVILEPRVCLVWRGDRDLLDLLDLQVLLVTPSLSLLPPSLVERQPRVFPALPGRWELLDLQERGEPMVRGDQGEGEECPAWQDLLELLEDRDCPADPAILETLESLDDL